MRYVPSGAPVANFSVAVNYRRGGQQGGEGTDDTQWFRVACWNKLAETVNEYVTKGIRVLVEGRFRGHSYTAQDGTERHVNEIVANRVLFLSRPGDGGTGGGGGAPSATPAPPEAFSDPESMEDIPF